MGSIPNEMHKDGDDLSDHIGRDEVIVILREYYKGLKEKAEIKLHGVETGDDKESLITLFNSMLKGSYRKAPFFIFGTIEHKMTASTNVTSRILISKVKKRTAEYRIMYVFFFNLFRIGHRSDHFPILATIGIQRAFHAKRDPDSFNKIKQIDFPSFDILRFDIRYSAVRCLQTFKGRSNTSIEMVKSSASI